MSRRLYMTLLLFAIVAWTLSAAFKLWLVLKYDRSFDETLTDPMTAFGFILIPIWAAELWKLIAAEPDRNVRDPHVVVQAGEPVIVRPLRALICVGFVAIGVLGLLGLLPFARAIPLPALYIGFIAMGAFGGVMVSAPRARLRLSPEGLEYSQMRPSHIPWHDIVDVKRKTIMMNPRVVLTLKNTTEFRAANPFARWRRVEKVTLMPLVFGLDAGTLAQGIEARRSVFAF